MKRLSGWQKVALVGGLSAGLLGGGELLQHETNQQMTASTMEWLGKVGLIGDGFALALSGIRVLEAKNQQHQQQELQVLKATLPKLSPDIDWPSVALKTALKERNDDIYEGTSLVGLLDSRAIAEGNELLAYNAIYEISNRAITDMTIGLGQRNSSGDHLKGRALGTCLILDEVLPIADDCPLTPQTEDPGKYWYDWVFSQACVQRRGLVAV